MQQDSRPGQKNRDESRPSRHSLYWFGMAFCALLCGFETVRYLISPPRHMTLHGVISVVCICLYALLVLRLPRIRARLAAFVFFLCCAAAGYLAASALYLNASDHGHALSLDTAGTAVSHTAVIYFTHGEPRTYEGSFEAWKHAISEMDKTGVPFVPWVFRPFFFKKVRDEYFEVGGSFHNLIHERTMDRIRIAYKQVDPEARFYMAYSDDSPSPGETAARAVREGASRIIVVNAWMTESDHLEGGINAIRELDTGGRAIDLCATEALWTSQRLVDMYVDRARRASGDMPLDDIGILLVAHGQPETWDALFPKQPEQENAFRAALKKQLVKKGFRKDTVKLCYMEFKQPDIQSSVRALLDSGVKKILVAPVNISAESIHSEHEIPSMVESTGVPLSVAVEHLGAWNDDPLLVEELIARLNACRT